MTDYDTDLADLVTLCADADIDAYGAIWAIFDRRTETGCPLIFQALTESNLAAGDDELDAIPTPVLEILARLLPHDATNSDFDALFWDLDDLALLNS